MKSDGTNTDKVLILGLGNELLADDAVGVRAAQRLKEELNGQADIVESSLSGLALLDLFVGYQKAIVIDAIQTNKHPPGTVIELSPADFDSVQAPSPHYSGLPEILALARQLNLEFPGELMIFALEVADPYTIGGQMTPAVTEALAELIDRVKAQLADWQKENDLA